MIKDQFGWRNFQGRNSLTQIDDNDQTVWLRRKRQTVESRNKGGHLTVKPLAVGVDGYYSIGGLTVGGIHVFGDYDAYGTFIDRGQFRLESGFVFNAASLNTRFDTYGQTLSAERLGYVANNQGIACPIFQYTSYITYNGTRYRALYGFYFTRVTFEIGSESVNGTYTTPPARFGPANAQGKINVGYGGIVMDEDLQFRPFYIRDYYGDDQRMEFPPCLKDQFPWEFRVFRMSPTIIMSMLVYVRSQYPAENPRGTPVPNLIDNSKCPGYEIRFSQDNGVTWTLASSTEFFKEFVDTCIPLAPDNPNSDPPGSQNTNENGAFNKAALSLILQVAPLSSTKAICYGLVPYVDDDLRVHAKVKLGIIDFAAGTVAATTTLFDDLLDPAWYYMGSQSCAPVKDGVMIVRAPPQGGDRWLDPHQPGFTPDGVSIAWQPALPRPGYQQGMLFGLGPNEIGSVVFIPGRGYVLQSTKDKGMTWKERALVATNGVPPATSNEQPATTNFLNVVRIRDSGHGANPYPSAPWAADSRVKAPIR